ncbi:MAG: methyltransferase [Methylomonas sp.]|jgi:16S rRNA (guanine1207-N2)-methyltransferase
MDTLLTSPQGEFQIRRYPLRNQELLRAWDAADEYLLNYLGAGKFPADPHIVVLNDSFGALAVALNAYRPTAISDSYVAHLATRYNLRANALAEDRVKLCDSLSAPDGEIDYLLIKIPKTLALLEDQLYKLQPLLKPGAKIAAAAMVKHMPPSIRKLLANMLGACAAAPAVKKARLIFVTPDAAIKLPDNPYPTSYALENTPFRLWGHANVFSRESLDIGARFLLQHLPTDPGYRDIIDLGCGNGVIGLSMSARRPDAKIYFADESYMAVASARMNFEAAFGQDRAADFRADDCLTGFPPHSADCIVCNPPFHQQHVVGGAIAGQMFKQSFRVLRPGGELRVIGNRHLDYYNRLKKLFGNCEIVAGNNKFVILKSFKFE